MAQLQPLLSAWAGSDVAPPSPLSVANDASAPLFGCSGGLFALNKNFITKLQSLQDRSQRQTKAPAGFDEQTVLRSPSHTVPIPAGSSVLRLISLASTLAWLLQSSGSHEQDGSTGTRGSVSRSR
jgi:hypothetical protein